MATIKPTIVGDQIMTQDKSVFLVTWAAVTEADVCQEIEMPDYADRCVQVTGTFGSATVVLQGSNDGTNWATLNNVQGTSISGTAAYLKQVAECPRYTRPSASGGTSQSVTITMILRRTNTMRT